MAAKSWNLKNIEGRLTGKIHATVARGIVTLKMVERGKVVEKRSFPAKKRYITWTNTTMRSWLDNTNDYLTDHIAEWVNERLV